MKINNFFVCPNCGNDRKFKVFTSDFQIVLQSPELGICMNKSGKLPNLRHTDNYVECQVCFNKSEYDIAADCGRKYISAVQRLKTKNNISQNCS